MTLQKLPIFAESWNVAFRKKPCGSLLEDSQTPFHIIPNSFRYWAADPFILEDSGNVYIFAELYDYIRRRGILGCCTIVNDRPTKWRPIITEAYHLSYPCLIRQDGSILLMPESGAGKELGMYEPVQFPYTWKKRQILREGVRFADTTPLPGSFSRFALTHETTDPLNPRLTLIDLTGQQEDRIVSGAVPLRSRPAGHFFCLDQRLIRPAQYSQDANAGYGKGLIFCQCHPEGEAGYREEELLQLSPDDLTYDRPIYLDGMHTYNASKHYEVIDIKTRRFNILNLFMRVAGKFLRR